MRYFTIFLLLCFQINFAQKSIKITYEKFSNGNYIENQDRTEVVNDGKRIIVAPESYFKNEIKYPVEYFTVHNNLIIQNAELFGFGKNLTFNDSNKSVKNVGSQHIYTLDSTSIAKQKLELLPDTKKILGYNCKKAKTVINSNTIELWYTNDLKIKGAPSTLGINLGLVLEMVRNGNFVITAKKIDKNYILFKPEPKENYAKLVDALTYKDLLWKSRFTTIPVFKDEVLNFSDESKSNDTIQRFGKGTIALRKVKFPEIKPESLVFLDLTEQSNGDAYDRTGAVFMIPTNKKQSFLDGLKNGVKTLPMYTNGNGKEYQGVVATPDYLPAVELMRFYTPFGIKQYNHIELKDKTWHDVVPYRQDISDYGSLLSNQEVWIGAFVGNYDKGGHKISCQITIHNEEGIKSKNLTVVPLFNTNNIMEAAGQEYGTMFDNDKGLEVSFTLDKPMKNARLRYITTGHGGWENGDEFVPKPNAIYLDNTKVIEFTPWRTDCGSYRLFNPASGNFPNGLSSSDYSRANWCPGTTTNPEHITLGDLSAGSHTLQIKIPQGKPEGTSFSSWNVSGVLIGE